MRKGKMVVFEGLNGSGKTYQAKLLAERWPAVYMHEVGSHRTSSFPVLLKRLLHMDNLSPITEQYFITGSRSFNLQQVNTFINNGYNVVYDRYIYSSHIYSNRDAMDQPEVTDAIWDLHDIIKKDIVPTVTIILDIDPDERKKRLMRRKEGLDKYEDVDDYVIEYRRNVYRALGRTRMHCHVIDGSHQMDIVFNRIRNVLRYYGI